MSGKSAVFRVDASLAIGTGHVSRCLTLAGMMRSLGYDVSFISRRGGGDQTAWVQQQGVPVHINGGGPGEDFSWEDIDWEEDAGVSADIIEKQYGHAEWLVVDHYGLDWRWEARLRQRAGGIMVIDDLANRAHDCDILLDQNMSLRREGRYSGLVPDHCRMLLGPSYALLRPEFLEARKTVNARSGRVKRLLLFFGGADTGNETGKALEAVRMLPDVPFDTDVIVGASSPWSGQIEDLCRSMDRLIFHARVNTMASLMAAADLAVGAGGTAMLERCFVGLPSLVVTIADNQVAPSESLAAQGAIRYMGKSDDITAEQISAEIRRAVGNPDYVSRMSRESLDIFRDYVFRDGPEPLREILRGVHAA